MKESIKWIIGVLVFAIIIVGAGVLYNILGEDNGGGSLIVDMTQNSETTKEDTGDVTSDLTDTDAVSDVYTDAVDDTDTDTPSDTVTPPETEESTEIEEPTNPAPDFTVIDVNGNEVKLSDLRGKPVVLNFWATWCGYCSMEMPDFDKMYKKYGDDIQFMMINVMSGGDTVEKGKSYIENGGYSFPIYFDKEGTASYVYGTANGIPLSYFIDAKGNLVAHALGAIDAETLEKGIEMIR